MGVVLSIAVGALFSGARSLYAITQWARDHRAMVTREFGLPPTWTPCHATFHRVFKDLDVEAFESALGEWLGVSHVPVEDAVAIDGKTLRGIHGEEIGGVHLVAAYTHHCGVVLAQAQARGKGHELAAAREALSKIESGGRVFTFDALYATRAFCQEVLEKGGTMSSR